MTNLQALQAIIEPYTASANSLELALTDEGLVTTDTYSDKKTLAKAAIKVLRKFLALGNESEGGFSQGYSIEGLKTRINELAAENSLTSEFKTGAKITNASDLW